MDEFYHSNELPDDHEKELIWSGIQRELSTYNSRREGAATIVHWRSFLMGNVAAILLILASTGAYTVYDPIQTENTSTQYKIDKAYQSAMQQMVSVTPEIVKQANDVEKPVLESKIQNIRNLDKMIKELRTDMAINGSSDVKKAQLRRLYAMKMDYVKELLLAGKVNL